MKIKWSMVEWSQWWCEATSDNVAREGLFEEVTTELRPKWWEVSYAHNSGKELLGKGTSSSMKKKCFHIRRRKRVSIVRI